MILDKSDIRARLALHHYRNRCHRGEIWLWVRHDGREFPVEQSQCPADAEVFGEIKSDIVGSRFVDEIVPVRRRSAAEIERRRRATESHKTYRADCWSRYSVAERIEDLGARGES
jgi:hypothetical protein